MLPLVAVPWLQAEMNNCLLMLLHSSADLMAGISRQAMRNAKSLRRMFKLYFAQSC